MPLCGERTRLTTKSLGGQNETCDIISIQRGSAMAEKRQINGRAIISDLRSGMADWELQVKVQTLVAGPRHDFQTARSE